VLDYNSTGVYTLHYALPPMPDTNAPASAVAALPDDSSEMFQVQWVGEDTGSGIAGYDVYVSANGSPFIPWLQRTPLESATYAGAFGVEYAFYSVATDNAGNRELPPPVPDALTVVTITNRPPEFLDPGEQVIDEGTTLQLTATASDPDGPASALTFGLGAGAPPGVLINPTTGRITWTTGEGTGPSTNQLSVRVRDQGLPPASATLPLRVVVREVNAPPALAAIPDSVVDEGTLLSFTNQAADPDLPANNLQYSLRNGAPDGATIHPASGVFEWRPSAIQGPSTNLLAVIVSDDGSPSLSVTQEFTVVVQDSLSDFTVRIGSTNVLAGETNTVPVVLGTGLSLNAITLLVEWPQDRLVDLALQPASAEVLSSALVPAGSNRFEMRFTLDSSAMQSGERLLAQLEFVAATNQSSAIVPLRPLEISGTRPGGLTVLNAGAFGGRVIVVGQEPVLWITRGAPPVVTLYGRPGQRYTIEGVTNLLGGATWLPMTSFLLTNRWADVRPDEWTAPMTFYRAYENTSENLRLTAYQVDGPVFALQILGAEGMHCVVQTTTNLGDTNLWLPVFDLVLTNTTHLVNWTNANEPGRFFRVMQLD
jgi:hypothetical protein